MTNKINLYYQQKQSKILYSTTPTGTPDVGRLIRGQPYWALSAAHQEQKPKTLILANSFIDNWPITEQEQLIKSLNELIDEGFIIYRWHGGTLVPLTKKSTDFPLNYTGAITEIKTAAAQLHVPQDEVLILDNHELRQLISKEKLEERQLFLSDLPSPSEPLQVLNWIKLFLEAQPPLTQFVLDLLPTAPGFQELLEELIRSKFPKLTLVKQPVCARFSADSIDICALQECAPKLSSLECSRIFDPMSIIEAGKPLSFPNLKHLKFHSLIYKLNYNLLFDWLNTTKKLNSLILLNMGFMHASSPLYALDLLLLEHFEAVNTYLNATDLSNILGRSERLTHLTLQGIGFNTDEAINVSLPALERLDLEKSRLTVLQLGQLLARSPKIASLHLANTQLLEDVITPEPILKGLELSALKTLDLMQCPLPPMELYELLKGAVNLENFTYYNLRSSDIPFGVFFTQLKKLSLLSSVLNQRCIECLIPASSQIEEIDLTACILVEVDFSSISLHNIRFINLSLGTLNKDALRQIALKASKLQTLIVNSVTIPPEGLVDLHFPALESLFVDCASLAPFLKAAPNIKKLIFWHSKSLGLVVPKGLCLKALEEIEMSGATLSAASFKNLLCATPKLKTINAPFFNLTEEDTGSLSGVSLPYLEQISLSRGRLSEDNLQHLLRAAPNLKHLYLKHFATIISNLSELTLASLETLDIGQCAISNEALITLINAAPNLKSLCITFLDLSESVLNTQALCKLTELIIDNDGGENAYSLAQILSKATTLCRLEISNTYLNKPLSLPDEFALSNIHTINLKACSISQANLISLLEATPDGARITLIDVRFTRNERLNHLLQKKRVVVINTDPLATDLSNVPEEPSKAKTTPETPDIPHDPSALQDFDPRDKPFRFQGTNRSKNQKMIIEKLSQYLSLKKEHLHLLPKLQKGICTSLAHFFITKDEVQWTDFVALVSAWNGLDLTTAPVKELDELFEYVAKYTLGGKSALPEHYLGDNLKSFFLLQPIGSQKILNNPWHTIAIRHDEEDSWSVYDPNYNAGVRKVTSGELDKTIHEALGSLVSVEGSTSPLKPLITDADEFIATGGLISLLQSSTATELLKQLPLAINISKEALLGLSIRTLNGTPAWAACLKNKTLAPYTYTLLEQLVAHYPSHQHLLKKSCEFLSPMQRHVLVEDILSYRGTELDKQLKDTLLQTLHQTTSLMVDSTYDKLLQTWSKEKSKEVTLTQFCLDCVNRYKEITNPHNGSTSVVKVSTRLIQTASSTETQGILYAIENHAKNTNRPIFYIDKPDDLICSAAFVAPIGGGKGQVQSGPGGPLYNFLQAHKDGKAPLLLVNYDNFASDDLVRFNSLLDKEGKADGEALPGDALVLGVMNTERPDCYQGADFYSRFTDRVDALKSLSAALILPELPKVSTSSEAYCINLYHASDWKERLLGRWTIDKDQLVFEEGELTNALTLNKKEIVLANAPWENDEFCQWVQHGLAKGSFDSGRIKLPDGFKLLRTEGYNWSLLSKQFALASSPSTTAKVLNSSTLNDYLQRYTTFDNKLGREDGFLEQARATKNLAVHLTSSLSDDEWARLLTACQQKGVTLQVFCAPGVQLPGALPQPEPPTPVTTSVEYNSRCAVLRSDDTDASLAKWLDDHDEKEWLVLDVSECTAASLLPSITGELRQGTSPRFHFTPKNSFLLDALKDDKHIILKGRFSKELMDTLAPLLLERQQAPKETVKGELVLISDDTNAFSYLEVTTHHVSKEKKKELVRAQSDHSEEAEQLIEESLAKNLPWCHIKAQLAALRAKLPNHDPFQGLETLAIKPLATEELNTATSAQECTAFLDKRRTQLNNLLADQPYAFLTGPSGVGKSTFIAKDFCSPQDKLYTGIHRISDWANDNANESERKILFIDEANLSDKEYSEFEGLFNIPPTLFIDGVLHTLSPNHKVIFAGNPVSYGDERKLAAFFKRHGNALVVDPLPLTVLYERILKPLFVGTLLTEVQQEQISKAILKCYQTLYAYSGKDLLISPRELQMMALLISQRIVRNPKLDLQQLSEQIIYDIAAPLVPKEYKEHFNAQCKPAEITSHYNPPPAQNDFYIPRAKHHLWHALEDRLLLRTYRMQKDLNEAQRYGGLGGLIIEGEPGVGKSRLVTQILAAMKYTEVTDSTKPAPSDTCFYRIPASMSLKEKEELLIKAFNEGAVVVIDELNSAPMMERLLNELLMGHHNNLPPKKPGFMVIATQNPITMAGRKAVSTALARRMTTVTMEPYTKEELIEILIHKKIPPLPAEALATSYLKQVETARDNHYTPEPTFRDLIEQANCVLHGLTAAAPQHKDEVVSTNPIEDSELGVLQVENSVQLLLKAQKINDAIIELSALSPEQQCTIIAKTMTTDKPLCPKRKLIATYLQGVVLSTNTPPILKQISLRLTSMNYNADYKREAIIKALAQLNQQLKPGETWEEKIKEAINTKSSPLYKALNIRRYGIMSSLFIKEARTLSEIKKEISKVESTLHPHKNDPKL